jgi:hypothetical protein
MGTNDAMKIASQSGISPTSPTTKPWACTIGGGILVMQYFLVEPLLLMVL